MVIDNREGEEAVVARIRKVLGDRKLYHAYDAVSERGSYVTLSKVLAPGGRITLISPGKTYDEIPESISWSIATVGSAHSDGKDLAFVFSRYLSRGLQEGWLRGQPHVVTPGGLGGVQKALKDLKEGKAHGIKYVFRIAETEGAGSG